MKHLLIIALALITLSASAQHQDKERKSKRSFNSDFTPEQIATLKTKRMALALDLTEPQQRKIQKLNLESLKERTAKKESKQNRRSENAERPSSKERFAHQNARLDKALSHKTEMKSILSKEQFEKWEKTKRPNKSRKGFRKQEKKLDKNRKFRTKKRR